MLDLVDLAATGARLAATLSLGMKQRLRIAVAVLHQPELLIRDEPTNGSTLGESSISAVRWNGSIENGLTVLVSSHILSSASAPMRPSFIAAN